MKDECERKKKADLEQAKLKNNQNPTLNTQIIGSSYQARSATLQPKKSMLQRQPTFTQELNSRKSTLKPNIGNDRPNNNFGSLIAKINQRDMLTRDKFENNVKNLNSNFSATRR